MTTAIFIVISNNYYIVTITNLVKIYIQLLTESYVLVFHNVYPSLFIDVVNTVTNIPVICIVF